ncbi:hypothetical protein DL93DRAFT_1476731 [Clavulina sp. PMI_390]|nr:hypothetical protein DL93DRAFT_1476731 [Clavulina sp. PMI_390]
MPWHQDPKTNRPKTKVTSASHFSWPQGRAVRYLNLLPILAFLCPFCRLERFSLERDLRHHQAACPHADNTVDSLPSTLESANGRNGGSPYFIPPQPFPQYLIYRERPSGDDAVPDRMRGGQTAFQSSSSLSQSNGANTPVPNQSVTSAQQPASSRLNTVHYLGKRYRDAEQCPI